MQTVEDTNINRASAAESLVKDANMGKKRIRVPAPVEIDKMLQINDCCRCYEARRHSTEVSRDCLICR